MRTLASLLLGLLSLLCCGGEACGGEVLIRAARAITLDGPPLEPVAVLVVDGKIREIATSLPAGPDVRVVDLGQAVLVPGFVNAYSQEGLAGGDTEFTREITPELDVTSAVDWESRSFRESLAEGVTSVGIAPGTDNVVAGVSFVVKTAGSDLEARIVKRRHALVVTLASDPGNRNRSRSRPDSIFVRQPTNRMGVVWMLRSEFDRARRQAVEGGLLAEALRGELPIFCVSRTHYDVESILRLAGEFDFSPVIVGGEEAHQLAPQLAAGKIPVILGPLSTAGSTGVEGTEPAWNRAGILHRSGVAVAFSGPQLLEQARFAVRFGLPADAALRAITLEPARRLGIDGRLGSLAAGRDADMVVLNGDPFEFTTAVQAVIIDGILFDENEGL